MRNQIIVGLFAIIGTIAHADVKPAFDDVEIGDVWTLSDQPITLHMDIYKPEHADKPTPVVLWIHGGAWRHGSYNDGIPAQLNALLEQGIAVASVQYRLSDQAPFPAQIEDVKGAVRFVRANAEQFGINPTRVAAFGVSAGGHLAALLGTSGGVKSLEGSSGGNLEQSSRVMAVVDYFGPTDFLTFQSDATDPPGLKFDATSEKSDLSKLFDFIKSGQGMAQIVAHADDKDWEYAPFVDLARLASPITHVTPDDAPMFIAHGAADTVVPLKQSHRLRDALGTRGVMTIYMESKEGGHGLLGDDIDQSAIRFLVDSLKLKSGDATRDGVVNEFDLKVVAQNYDRLNQGWSQGDFNNDGKVDFADLLLVSQNYEGAPGHSFDEDWNNARQQ